MRVNHFLFSIAISLLILGCNSNKLESVPAHFIGDWKTTANKYRGFTIEIKDRFLLFKDSNGQQSDDIYPISRIEKDDKKNDLYTIFYKTKDGLEYQFAFYYEESGGGIIRLKNQKKYEWKKIDNKEG